MSITGLMVATPGGMLGDRLGRRRIIITGLAALAVGDLAFILTGDLVTFLAASALIGFGDFFASSQTALLSEIVPPEHRTQVLSSYRFSADLGAFIGPVLLAAVMDLANAQTAILVAVAILAAASLVTRLGVPAVVDLRPAREPAAAALEKEHPMTPDDVVKQIDPQEVVDLALALGNIDSPTGAEGPAGQFVYDWLASNGFAPKKYALIPERFNVAATIAASGGGYSLVFNAHLDTTLMPDAVWSARDPRDPLYHSAWVEGDEIFGDGVVNDKGPMAAFLVAAKAIKRRGLSAQRRPHRERRGRRDLARADRGVAGPDVPEQGSRRPASWSRTVSSPISPSSRRGPASGSSGSSRARPISR